MNKLINFRYWPRILTIIICIAALLQPMGAIAAASFSDTANHWASYEIESWAKKGYVSGYPDGSFKPDRRTTRAEFMAFVNRSFDLTRTTRTNYSDMEAGAWYEKTIAIAEAAGYISGYPDGTIRPNMPISREEAASIIMRLVNLTPIDGGGSNFTDSDEFSWSYIAVLTVAKAGIMNGYQDNTFQPQKNISRAETVVSLERAIRYDGTGPVVPPVPPPVTPPITTGDKLVTVAPQEDSAVIVNPYMGYAPRANQGSSGAHSLVFAYMYWYKESGDNAIDLEPEDGVYNWQAWETQNRFSYWKSKGAKIIIRFVLDEPKSMRHMNIPQWLYDKIGGDGVWYNTSYGQGFSPNYSNPVLIAEHAQFIKALAARYNNDPFVAWIELGSVGHWGEWHVHININSGASAFPKENIADQYVQPYLNGFTNKKLLTRRPTNIAIRNEMGLFNDLVGNPKAVYDQFLKWINNGYTLGLTGEKIPPYTEYWKNAPCGGETMIGGTTFYSDSNIDAVLKQIKDLKLTYLKSGVFSSSDAAMQKNASTFAKTIGYRFVITSASFPASSSLGRSINVSVKIANKGVAPFYFNWPVKINLTNNSGTVVASQTTSLDLRKLAGGQSASATAVLNIPGSVAAGSYKINVSVVDPETGKSGIIFANAGRNANGSLSLGVIKVN